MAARHGRAMAPAAGQAIEVGGLRLQRPLAAGRRRRPEGNPNDHAIVSRLEVGAFSMLLTADAESNVTLPLELGPVDVLKVAHHGSADPGLPALLERLRPRIAAIEVGRDNTLWPSRRRPRSRRSRARFPPSYAPTGTARSASMSPATACGCSDESARGPEPAPACSARMPRAHASRSVGFHTSITEPSLSPLEQRYVCGRLSRIPSRKGLLNREIAIPCGYGRCAVGIGALAAPAAHAAHQRRHLAVRRSAAPRAATTRSWRSRNVSAATVDISGWTLWGANSTGTTQPRATVPAGRRCPPADLRVHEHHGSLPRPAMYSTAPASANTGGIQIRNGATRDGRLRLAERAGSRTARARASLPSRPAGDNGFTRKGNGTQDTDDNAADFNGPLTPTPPSAGRTARRDGPAVRRRH